MLGESGIEAGAGIIKGLGLIVLCSPSFSSVLLLMRSEKMIDGYSMVGRQMTIRPLESVCISERIFGLYLSGRVWSLKI